MITAMIQRYLLVLLLSIAVVGCIAGSIEIDPQGQQHNVNRRPQPHQATFVNNLEATTVNLYWAGNVNSISEGSLKLYYGPLPPNGGVRVVDAYEGQVFVLTDVSSSSGYERLGEYRLGITQPSSSSDGNNGKSTYILTEESANEFRRSFPPPSLDSERRETNAQKCRSINIDAKEQNYGGSGSNSFLDRCQRCAKLKGCGFSLVRDRLHENDGVGIGGCYGAHAVATVNDADECKMLNEVKDDGDEGNNDISVEAWLNRATELTLSSGVERGGGVHNNESGPSQALRLAYACLERAVDMAQQLMLEVQDKGVESSIKSAEKLYKKANAALLELTSKLEAVFDDEDAIDLLESSRHPKLAEIHPNMPAVPRRIVSEAIEYIVRGEPVVITNLFDDNMSSPVAHKWTLEYLNQKVFGSTATGGEPPKFNVAADLNTRCCRYFEPQGKSKISQYPYPFAPTTHLYRDSFDGFVKTVRKANRNAAGGNGTTPKLLHYLHEIVMNRDGRAVVAGGKAPKHLADDLESVTSKLRPLASKQPFFGGFAFAKIWLGQRGIVMPIHYDATDNMYVMAWGRKRAIIGEPGQLDELYRYPNGHPLVGSSQVNLTDPDMDRYPHFKDARLREVIVSPGDVLYLPAWWWHQFEQPFEDTAALNLWSKDDDDAPDSHVRQMAVREHILADNLEQSVSGKDAGIIFDALANGENSPHYTKLEQERLKQAKNSMLQAASSWQHGVSQLPGGHPKIKQSAVSLVEEHLDRTHKHIMNDVDLGKWHPGDSWDLSNSTTLPHELRNRCEPAPEASPFMSICG